MPLESEELEDDEQNELIHGLPPSSDMAERTLEEAARQDPLNAAKHCKLADYYRKKGKFSLANVEYKEAVRLDPDNDAYHWSLGQFYENEGGELELAEAEYHAAVKLVPGDPHNHLCLGRIYEKQNKLDLAEGEYRKLAEISPSQRYPLAQVLEKQGKGDVALAEYGKATQQAETDLDARTVARRRRKNRLAIMFGLTAAVAAAFVLTVLQYQSTQENLLDQLKRSGETAVLRDASNKDLKGKLIALEDHLEKVSDERDNLRGKTALLKEMSQEKERLEVEMVRLKQRYSAMSDERARLRKRQDASRHLYLASKHLAADKPDDAIKELRLMTEIDPKNPVAWEWLGVLYHKQGHLERAKLYYKRASDLGYKKAAEMLKEIEEEIASKGVPDLGTDKTFGPRMANLVTVYESSVFDNQAGPASFDQAKSLIATKQDIVRFVALLKKYEKRKGFGYTGAFLSGLMQNLGRKEDIILDLSHLDVPLHYLGANFPCRSLTIKGNVGDFLGRSMKRGTIRVGGSAGAFAGFLMQGGEIVISGSAGDAVGDFMQLGRITVHGNAGNKLGTRMRGGEVSVKGKAGKNVGSRMSGGNIRIEGTYEKLARDILGGTIYHRKEKIYP